MNVGDLNTYLKSYDKFLTETSSYQGGQINTLHDFPEAGLSAEYRISESIQNVHDYSPLTNVKKLTRLAATSRR